MTSRRTMSFDSPYKPSTVIIMCGDRRLVGRDNDLFNYFTAVDGIEPYRAILPGGCLPYTSDEFLAAVIRPYIILGARHVHAEGHMGANAKTCGCKAYGLRHADINGSRAPRYTETLEHEDHEIELGLLVPRLHRVAAREDVLITVNTGVFMHYDSGVGEYEAISTERQLPTQEDVLAWRTLLPSGSRPY